MLSKELQKRLVALYLNSFATAMKADSTGQVFAGTAWDDTGASALFDQYVKNDFIVNEKALSYVTTDPTPEKLVGQRAFAADYFAKSSQAALPLKDTSGADQLVQQLSVILLKSKGVKLSAADCKAIALELINADKAVYEVQGAILRGDWSPLEKLQEKVERSLRAPYTSLSTAIEKHKEKYLADKPNVQEGTREDMRVECRVLEEIFGDISIAEFNTMESVTKLKTILAKYPKNRKQRYGDRSIHGILKSGHRYQTISLKTANTYINRAKAVVDTARKAKLLDGANVFVGELFETETAAEEQRAAYDNEDIRRLIAAICNEPLYQYGDPKPERFWIILIALFHGFRLGNIVALTKEDIAQTDKGTWVFLLRQGKTKSTVRPVAICDILLLLGFLEWAEKLPRRKLFQDNSRSFSSWYNRDETHKRGNIIKGFEARHVTTDKKKCLYSLRHTFAGNVFDITGDFKITSDMMGHSTGRSVTARYTKRTKTETLKQVADKMNMEHIDLDMLEARALELFSC